MIQQLFMFVIFAMLIGVQLGLHTDTTEIIKDLETKYVGALDSTKFEPDSPQGMIMKGMFLIAGAMAILTTDTLNGLDISPVLWLIVAILFLPIKHILAVVWLVFEFLSNTFKKITGKKVSA